jgi:hypothetical protein
VTPDFSFTARRGGLPLPVAGVFALVFPVAITVLSISVSFRQVGDMSDLASSLLAALLFLVAAPTAWIFAIDFIDVNRLVVILVGIVTSYPLWFFAGTRLALFAATWAGWLRRYIVLCLAWTSANIVILLVIGQLTG